MKKNVIRIVNLIVIFLVAIVAYVFLKNMPSMLIGKDEDSITKVEQNIKAVSYPGINFDNYNPREGGNWAFASKDFDMDDNGLYLNFPKGHKYIFCVEKGAQLTKHGMSFEKLEELAKAIENVPATSYKNSEEAAITTLNSKIREEKLKGKEGITKVITSDGKELELSKLSASNFDKTRGFKVYGTYIYYFEIKDKEEFKAREANAREAYILTYQGIFSKDYDEFCEVRQEAIWQTDKLRYARKILNIPSSGTKHVIRTVNSENAKAMMIQARNYQKFINKIVKQAGHRNIEGPSTEECQWSYENINPVKAKQLVGDNNALITKHGEQDDDKLYTANSENPKQDETFPSSYDEKAECGIVLASNTKNKEIKIDVLDGTTKKYIVGPFQIDYLKGDYTTKDGEKTTSGATYGGMSDLYLVDKDNKIVIDSTRLKFSDNKSDLYSFKGLKLFEPIEKAYIEGLNYPDCEGGSVDNPKYEKNTVPYTGEEFEQVYPEPNQTFYLQFEATQAEFERITDLKVDFEWMEAHASIKWYEGKAYYIDVSDLEISSQDIPKEDGGGTEYSAKYGKVEIKDAGKVYATDYDADDSGSGTGETTEHHKETIQIDPQHTMDIEWDETRTFSYKNKIKREKNVDVEGKVHSGDSSGRRTIHLERLTINIPRGNQDEPLQMELAGFVWQDIGEKAKTNGGIDGKFKDGQDIFKEGVEVILYYADTGEMVKQNETKVDELGNTKVVERKHLINPYVTGSNGHYEFKDLDADRRYIIKYVYDGQMYEATYYTSENNLPKDLYYPNEDYLDVDKGLNKYNDKDYQFTLTNLSDVNSGAVEFDRQKFNERFKTINSSPRSYKVTRIPGQDYNLAGGATEENSGILGYNRGDWNTVWNVYEYENSNSTQFGIKGLYEKIMEIAINRNDQYKISGNPVRGYRDAYIYAKDNYETLKSAYNLDSREELYSKLQFIEDTRIVANNIAQNNAMSARTFPVLQNFGIVYEKTYDYTSEEFQPGVGTAYYKLIGGTKYYAMYPTHLNIDFGITARDQFDLALKKDVEQVTLEINGKEHVYTYDDQSPASSEKDKEGSKAEDEWEISARLNGDYYASNRNYTRYIYAEDYLFKANMYKSTEVDADGNITGQVSTPEVYGKSPNDELKVYVTYKITVRNQSQNILGKVCEVVDYYDTDYIYVPEKSYIEIKRGTGKGIHEVLANDLKDDTSSVTDKNSMTYLDGYNRLYVTGLNKDSIKLSSGQTAYIYLTFRVDKTEIGDFIILDENREDGSGNQVGKENIAEITAYQTYYNDGHEIPNKGKVTSNDIAGMIDRDSVSGNAGLTKDVVAKNKNNSTTLKGINYANMQSVKEDERRKYFEDDMDKSLNIRLRLYRNGDNGNPLCREIKGTVWEDLRTVWSEEQKTSTGNGIKDVDDPTIDGVTVQLVEIIDMPDPNGNGKEYIWKEFGIDTNKINHNNDMTDPVNAVDGYTKEGGSGTESDDPIVTDPASTDKITIDRLSGLGSGQYGFKSFVPGNYVVRFIYGDTVKTVIPSNTSDNIYYKNEITGKGKNTKSYNGQDYKSTVYQSRINSDLTSSSVNDIDAVSELENRNGDYWEVNEDGYITYKWLAPAYNEVIVGTYINRYLNDDNQWVYIYKRGENDYIAICRYWDGTGWKYRYVYETKYGETTYYSGNETPDGLNPEINKTEIEFVPTYQNDSNSIMKKDQNETVDVDRNTDTQNGYLYDIGSSNKFAEQYVSDAKDIEGRTDGLVRGTRNYVNLYSNKNVVKDKDGNKTLVEGGKVNNYLAEELASHSKLPQNENINTRPSTTSSALKEQYLEELMENTFMKAETGMMVIECENNMIESNGLNDNTYVIDNLDLGLVERPKAQLSLNKEVTNVRVTLADGSTLFDIDKQGGSIYSKDWIEHKNHLNYYERYFNKDHYMFETSGKQPIEIIRTFDASPEVQFGLIAMEIDEELMHGATIKISYKVTVTNVGEVDYYNSYDGSEVLYGRTKKYDRAFYYTGKKDTNAKVVETTADKVVDYVSNNLQYYDTDNKSWKLLTTNEINPDSTTTTDDLINKWFYNFEKETNESGIKEEYEERKTLNYPEKLYDSILSEYNVIIQTQDDDNSKIATTSLKPYTISYEQKDENSVTDELVLTQLITSENEEDNLTYRNVAEIVLTTNDLGRRNAYSIVGNQDPRVLYDDDTMRFSIVTEELDADSAHIVKLGPPTGNSGMPQIIAAIVASTSAIVIAGVVFIKKKILR